jgi:glycerol uptake facilitator-like aquaporin
MQTADRQQTILSSYSNMYTYDNSWLVVDRPNSNDASCIYSIVLQVWTVSFTTFVCTALLILLIMTINRPYNVTSVCFMTISKAFRIVQALFYEVLF